jgi:hypothetical protein
VGDETKSFDSAVERSGVRCIDLDKSTYRVLLTRGMNGCRAVCLDGATRDHVRSRLEQVDEDGLRWQVARSRGQHRVRVRDRAEATAHEWEWPRGQRAALVLVELMIVS